MRPSPSGSGSAQRGEVRSRRRVPYSASTLRDYRSDLSRFVLRDLGHLAVNDVTRGDVQAIIERMNGEGFAGQTVRNAIVALQAFYRWKKPPIDPTVNLDLPEPGGRRERAATPSEAELLLSALDGDAHDIYAAAFYAGLRRGELQALRVEDVHADRIRVSRSWDQVTGEKAPKSKAGERDVPIVEPLRSILERRCAGRPGSAFVFGDDDAPFSPNTLRDRAIRCWAAAAVGAFLRGGAERRTRPDRAARGAALVLDVARPCRGLGDARRPVHGPREPERAGPLSAPARRAARRGCCAA